jgi:hypothetical protein
MDTDSRHAEFEIDYLENDEVRISSEGFSISTEYLPDNRRPRRKMTAANILFSSFAL